VNSTNVLRRRGRPTKSSYQDAIKKIVESVGSGLTDDQLAEKLSCSSGTISNARNKKANLCAVTLANIGYEFGPEAIEPFAALFDCIVVPRQSQAANDLATIAQLSHVAGDWVERLRDGRRCEKDTAALAVALKPLLTALSAIVKEAEDGQAEEAA
jgi:transcriptional regulator with XRE-family HTH domain